MIIIESGLISPLFCWCEIDFSGWLWMIYPMKRMLLLLTSLLMFISVRAERALEIYWVDVEGGAVILMITSAGQSILMDTSNPGTRNH